MDGAGDGTADGWHGWPAAITGCGAIVLAHDKPGCGGSPGDWREQTFEDRASETLAAVELLREQPGVDPSRVGLFGVSQGGWVAYLAASLAPRSLNQIVSVSGPGIPPFEQERFRLACATGGEPEALAWVDERARRIAAGESPDTIISAQSAYADRSWFAAVSAHYDDPGFLRFAARICDFDPATVLPDVGCPVFAAFGGADRSVPVGPSVAAISTFLPPHDEHALAVFPRADHNLFIQQLDRTAPLAHQLAPGFLAMLEAWLKAAT